MKARVREHGLRDKKSSISKLYWLQDTHLLEVMASKIFREGVNRFRKRKNSEALMNEDNLSFQPHIASSTKPLYTISSMWDTFHAVLALYSACTPVASDDGVHFISYE